MLRTSMHALRACKRETLDCNPSGYHDCHPKGDHAFKIKDFNSEALDCFPKGSHGSGYQKNLLSV